MEFQIYMEYIMEYMPSSSYVWRTTLTSNITGRKSQSHNIIYTTTKQNYKFLGLKTQTLLIDLLILEGKTIKLENKLYQVAVIK